MATALVIGGTGPTGPGVVGGLLDRGYDVTIMHGGQHEAALPDEVPHIHADPHFREPLEAALAGRTFDLVVAQYGRLRIVAEVLAGRTDRLVAVGGATASVAAPDDPRWGRLGRPVLLDEPHELLEDDLDRHKFGARMAEAERALFAAHDRGAYAATYLGYPILYGPRQLMPHEWCIVRRLRDGRRRLVIADGGLRLESRLYTGNAVHALLLAVDRPEATAGQKLVITDDVVLTMRQRIAFVAAHMGMAVELVDLPYELATPCHVYWRHGREHRLRDPRRARELLGYRDATPVEAALAATVDWLLAHPPRPGGAAESRLGDPFDYARENELVAAWTAGVATVRAPDYGPRVAAHPYRHPKQPGEAWARPT